MTDVVTTVFQGKVTAESLRPLGLVPHHLLKAQLSTMNIADKMNPECYAGLRDQITTLLADVRRGNTDTLAAALAAATILPTRPSTANLVPVAPAITQPVQSVAAQPTSAAMSASGDGATQNTHRRHPRLPGCAIP